VKLRHDVWCGDNPLSLCFLELFKISNVKEAYVALMQFLNGVLYWDLEFLRAIQDWELESLYIFWDVIYGVLLRVIGEDKMCWTPSKSRGFEVSNLLLGLVGCMYSILPLEKYLKQKILFRVAFIVWIAALGTILTIDNLCKRKVLILDWCYVCKSNGESVDHIFLDCTIVFELWSMVFTLFGIYWAMSMTS